VEDLVERLGRVDQLDRERVRQEAEATRLRTTLAEGRAALAAATAGVAEAQALVDANRGDERQAQRRIDELKQKRLSAVRILETGAGDATAAQRQLENCERLIDETETAMLEILEAQDRVKGAMASARAREAAATEALAKLDGELPPRIADLAASSKELKSGYEVELGALPAEIKKRYTTLRAAGKWPVVHVKDGSCLGCRMTVPPQNVAEVRKGRLLECMGCHRWLVVDG
jgi:uncharacterized protein